MSKRGIKKRRYINRFGTVRRDVDNGVVTKSVRVVTLTLGGVALLILFGFTFFFFSKRKGQVKSAESIVTVERMLAAQQGGSEQAAKMARLEENYLKLAKATETYFLAETVEEMSRLVLEPEKHRESITKFFNTERKILYPNVRTSEVFVQGVELRRVFVLMDDFPRILDFEVEQGRFDWESSQGQNIGGWDIISEYARKSAGVPVRVLVEQSEELGYYNYDYHDADEWEVFRLSMLGEEARAWGYVRRGSALAERLNDKMLDTSSVPRFVLRLLLRGDQANQYEIVELISPLWWIKGFSSIEEFAESEQFLSWQEEDGGRTH